jgi:DNA-binding GntR family transcriptional regulator
MLETSLLGHQEIFDALRLRNVNRAGKAMKKHLSYVERFMDRYYQVVLPKSSTRAKDPP